MRSLRPLAFAAMASTLALGLLAAPASAQVDPRLAIVNGIPGRTVDVFTGGAEVGSRLDYRDFVVRSFDPGSRRIRFRAAGPGTCKGELLARTSLELGADQDLAVVATERAPMKVVVFRESHPNTDDGQLTFGYAGDVGDTNVAQRFAEFMDQPAAEPIWHKGDKNVAGVEFVTSVQFQVFLAGAPQPFRETRWIAVEPGERTWVILVGSSTADARFVRIARRIPVS